MGRTTLLFTILLLSVALPLSPSLSSRNRWGIWRGISASNTTRTTKKATKVFTNDNLPAPVPGEAVNSHRSRLPRSDILQLPVKHCQTRYSPVLRGNRQQAA